MRWRGPALVLLAAVAAGACGGGGSLVGTRGPGTSSTASSSAGGPTTTSVLPPTTTPAPGTTASGGSAGSATGSTVTGVTTGRPTTTLPPPTTAPTVTTTTAPPPGPAGTGVYGYVTAGPTCPVEQANNPCPPKPVSGQVEARNGAGTVVGSTATDAQGRYALRLAPGSYSLDVVTSSGWPRCPTTAATVGASAPARVDISCDTGIR